MLFSTTTTTTTTATTTSARMSSKLLVILLLSSLTQVIQQVGGSGIFEINFSSLVDNLGRDLREDCCSWQQKLASSSQQQALQQGSQQQQDFQHQCDPSKCQLIIRICVKNFQTQIDPSQCTFGELSAQVMKPNGPANLHPNYPQFNPMAAASSASQLNSRRPMQAPTTAANIHHQRMLLQQQLLSSSSQHQAPFAPKSTGPRLYSNQRGLRSIAFNQPISFPFNFTWPGAFSLIVDAWFETPSELPQVALPSFSSSSLAPTMASAAAAATTTYDLYRKQLVIKHSMHGWLGVKNDWTNEVHKTDLAALTYSYRVTCQPNYYGEQCNILCRPRDGVYGHYTCSPQGDIVCRPGWQGSYCLDPICSPGCHKDQGNCSRPNECNCRIGWEGPSCEQCVRFPGCVHGFCGRPHECICQEGWGGLLCNEDLNYCSNHKPCKNGALCTNAFDSTGAGSYTCDCLPGFAGKDCEIGAGTYQQEVEAALQEVSQLNHQVIGNNETNITSILGYLAPKPASNPPKTHHPRRQPPSITHKVNDLTNRNIVPPTSTTTTPAPQIHPHPHHPHQQQQQQQVEPARISSMYQYVQPVTQQPSAAVADNIAVVVAYGIIIVCGMIFVVLLFLRVFLERTNQRQWHQESNQVEDVATLQNHQNIYKSRTSLSTATTTDKMMMPYDALDSSSSPESSSASSSSSSSINSSPTHRQHNNNHHHHHHSRHHPLYTQQAAATSTAAHERRYRSHHNLHNQSTVTSSPTNNPLTNPPPPYTISHSHPNSTTYMDYNNSNYNLSLANHHLHQPAASQAGPGSIYGAYSTTYGQLAGAGTNSIYQSPYYVICRLVDPADPLNAAAAAAAAAGNVTTAAASDQHTTANGANRNTNKFSGGAKG